jgi:hypothetical protein
MSSGDAAQAGPRNNPLPPRPAPGFGASTGFRELERNGEPNGEEVRRWNPELAGPDFGPAPSAALVLIPKVLRAFLADGMAGGPGSADPSQRDALNRTPASGPVTVSLPVAAEPEASAPLLRGSTSLFAR